jgi:hypothetical protein
MRIVLVSILVALAGCGDGGTKIVIVDDGGATCVANNSVSCTGPGGCAGSQVCAVDGRSFGDCTCGDLGVAGDLSMPADLAMPAPDFATPPDMTTPPPPVTVAIAPTTATLNPGQKQTFAATVTGSPNGGVFWSIQEGSGGGTISSDGVYVAPSINNTYHVIATSMADPSKSASAAVTVTTASPQVAVTITPGPVTLDPGQGQTFGATVSNTATTTVTWKTSGGTIDQSGNYTAPPLGGTFTVTATSTSDPTKSDTVIVTVRVATLAGTISYGGSATGRVYLSVVPNCINCGAEAEAGTSLAAPGAYTIRGVPQGQMVVVAWIDRLGVGKHVASDPSGTANVTVNGNGTIAVPDITIMDTTPATPQPPGIQAVAGGADALLVVWKGSGDSLNGEAADHYKIYCSTSATPDASNSTLLTVPAGTNGAVMHPLAAGSWYCAVSALAGGVEGAKSSVAPPATVGPPSAGGPSLSGIVNLGVPATGSLYVLALDQQNFHLGLTRVATPSGAQSYTVPLPANGNYSVLTILDQGDDGILGPLDPVTTLDSPSGTMVSGPGAVAPAIDLATVPAFVKLNTTHELQSTEHYRLTGGATSWSKQVVAATLVAGAELSVPHDVGMSSRTNGVTGQVSFSFDLDLAPGLPPPAKGDAYLFDVTFSDGTTSRIGLTLPTAPMPLPTPIAPTGSAVSTTPTFMWSAPSPAPSGGFSYEVDVYTSTGNRVYQANQLSSTTTSVGWNGAALSPSTSYTWRLYVFDVYGNAGEVDTPFTTQ